jgi:glutamate-1-semialdehyde 2,1-aminomutase
LIAWVLLTETTFELIGVERFNLMKFDRSKKLYEEAKIMTPGGVSSGIRQTEWPVPLFFHKAKGSKMWDVDGNEYIDYVMGMGPNLFGHAPDFITDAVNSDMQRGYCLTGQFEKENELSYLIRKALPYDFQVRYASSGTEIDQLALRVARAVTGKSKYLKFEGHYHGWMDSVLYNTHPEIKGKERNFSPQGESLGMSKASENEVIISPWNDLDQLQKIVGENKDDLSSMIMEPILWNSNVILPEPGYLEGARKICDKFGILLIFDEVGTGFRVALGGAQEMYDVKPDIATYAKAMAGGFPIAMIAGDQKIMHGLSTGEVMHGGSFNSNVMSISAAHAGLTHIMKNSEGFYKNLNQLGQELINGLSKVADKTGIDVLIQGLGSFFYLSFTSSKSIKNYRDHINNVDLEKYQEFVKSMLMNGVRLSQNGRWHMSSAHTEEDVEKTILAAQNSFELVG